VTPKQLSAALEGAYVDQVQAAVAAGKLTQAQANAIKRRLQQRGTVPLGAWRSLGRLRTGWPPAGSRFSRSAVLVAAACTYLGVSQAQLGEELSSGRSLAQIAQARGKSAVGLKDAMIAAERSRLAKLVASNSITGAQERHILTSLPARLDSVIYRRGISEPFGFHRLFRDRAPASGVLLLTRPALVPG
jgi:hypothetical protein